MQYQISKIKYQKYISPPQKSADPPRILAENIKIFLILLIFLLLPKSILGVEVRPARIEISAPAGKIYDGSLKLVNHQNYEMEISLTPSLYRYVFTKNTIRPSDKKELPSCEEWFKFKENKITLGAGESGEINYTILVPEGSKGEYLASISVDEKEAVPASKLNVSVTQRLTIPLYLTIQNTEKLDAEVTNLKIIKDSPQKDIVEFQAIIKNSGNVHLRASGNMLILDAKGKIVKNIPVGESLPVFPGYSQIIPVWWKGPSSGKYTAVITVDAGASKLLQKKIDFEIL